MKKLACLLFCLVLLLPLSACTASAPSNSEKEGATEQDRTEQGEQTSAATDGEDTTESKTENEAAGETEAATEAATEDATEDATEGETESDSIITNATAEIGEQVIYLFEGDEYTLHATVDESDPNALPPHWSSSTDAVRVDENGTVTAIHEGYSIVSAGGERVCSVRVLALEMPTVLINTGGSSITSKETYVPCLITVQSSHAEFSFKNAGAGVRLRGNSTFGLDKKPYRIKFNSKRNLLGMNEGGEYKSWVLLAERVDDSMIHNSTALSLASQILTEYTSDWRYVTLYLNGNYEGVYLLTEQSQINEGRVDIEEAGEESAALESGYLFEMDRRSAAPAFRIIASGMSFSNFLGEKHNCKDLVFNIKNDGLSAEQKSFAEKYFKNVFQIVYSATYEGVYYAFDENYDLVPASTGDPRTVISAVVDIDSLVRKYIHSELVCNSDDHQLSYYTHVDLSEEGSGLFTFSCPWDYDYAFSDSQTKLYHDPEAYFAARRTVWYVMIMNHSWFRELVQDYWNALYANTGGFSSVRTMMERITEIYEKDFRRDTIRWARNNQPGQAAIMYEWVDTRIAWLNERFGAEEFLAP